MNRAECHLCKGLEEKLRSFLVDRPAVGARECRPSETQTTCICKILCQRQIAFDVHTSNHVRRIVLYAESVSRHARGLDMRPTHLGDARGTTCELFLNAVRPPALPLTVNIVLAANIIKSCGRLQMTHIPTLIASTQSWQLTVCEFVTKNDASSSKVDC